MLLVSPDSPLKRINDMSPLHQSLHFVLLFPTGQLDWNPKIELTFHNQTKKLQKEYLRILDLVKIQDTGPSVCSVPHEGDTAVISGVWVEGWKGTE
jgi:hypothetical protein